MNATRELDEQSRRARQATLGLFVEPKTVTNNQQDNIMQEASVTPSNKTSRAAAVLEHLSKPPTFREVAIYEAKKAAVWAPVLASTLLGVFWVNKRYILKAATRL
jgi:hypothetical protein